MEAQVGYGANGDYWGTHEIMGANKRLWRAYRRFWSHTGALRNTQEIMVTQEIIGPHRDYGNTQKIMGAQEDYGQ